MKNALALLSLLVGVTAEARVFDINTENFASYFKGQYGTSSLAQLPFAPSGGNGTTYDSSYSSQMGYEFGFVYASRYMSMRFGFEVIKPPNLATIKGSDAAGSEWFTLNNNITVYAPKLGVEMNVKQWKESRLFLSIDYGSASGTIENSYKFTTAGSNQFGGIADFREEIKGSAALMEYALGYELYLFDSTTVVFDAGYRQLTFATLSHNVATTTFQGAVAKGDPALNTDGSKRSYDLGGPFASIMFRFWIQ